MIGLRICLRMGMAVLVASSLVGLALADITSITYTPSPIVIGNGVLYTANDNGTPQIKSWKWEYRCPGANWVAASGTNTCLMYEGYAGNYEIRCTASFQAAGYPPVQKPDQPFVINITINPPDSDGVVAGLNTPASIYGGQVTIDFQLYSGGKKVGAYIQGTPEERIRRPQFGFDSGWSGPIAGTYFLHEGVIKDVKSASLPADQQAAWDATPVGGVIDDFYQQNRLKSKDSCNTEKFYYFPEHHFQRVKVDANNWKLIEL